MEAPQVLKAATVPLPLIQPSSSTDAGGEVLRLCEWSSVRVSPKFWNRERREEVARAAQSWREEHRLSHLPLIWEGSDGCMLRARQWVGVVEVAGATIEIFPKLDAHLLDEAQPGDRAGSVLRSLLWMMEASGMEDALEAETAGLDESPLSFVDLWAYLLAKNLRARLQGSASHAYRYQEDTVHAVRGRIQIAAQVSRHWNRMDRVACAWDEWTPDIPLNRVLKCACRWLYPRVGQASTRGLLFDCLLLLDGVADVPPQAALMESARLVHTRASEPFRLSFELARRILQGSGPALGAGGGETWVFLADMNRVFEAFCRAVLEARFEVAVEEQKYLGTLLELKKGGIQQKADFRWKVGSSVWIGDAKYKHLARNSHDSLGFSDGDEDEADDQDDEPEVASTTGLAAGRMLSPSDVRQLGVYAELEKKRRPGPLPGLMLLYPFVGSGRFAVSRCGAWNGAELVLMPVRIQAGAHLDTCLAPS
jgi:5-methylcytosine-specific restriction endonuclease McrBC regulatory subunit McrC